MYHCRGSQAAAAAAGASAPAAGLRSDTATSTLACRTFSPRRYRSVLGLARRSCRTTAQHAATQHSMLQLQHDMQCAWPSSKDKHSDAIDRKDNERSIRRENSTTRCEAECINFPNRTSLRHRPRLLCIPVAHGKPSRAEPSPSRAEGSRRHHRGLQQRITPRALWTAPTLDRPHTQLCAVCTRRRTRPVAHAVRRRTESARAPMQRIAAAGPSMHRRAHAHEAVPAALLARAPRPSGVGLCRRSGRRGGFVGGAHGRAASPGRNGRLHDRIRRRIGPMRTRERTRTHAYSRAHIHAHTHGACNTCLELASIRRLVVAAVEERPACAIERSRAAQLTSLQAIRAIDPPAQKWQSPALVDAAALPTAEPKDRPSPERERVADGARRYAGMARRR